MQKIFYSMTASIVIMMLCLVFSSCSKDDDTDEKEETTSLIIGKWKETSYYIMDSDKDDMLENGPIEDEVVMIFYANGKFEQHCVYHHLDYEDHEYFGGTYTLNGDQLTMTITEEYVEDSDEGSYLGTYQFKITDLSQDILRWETIRDGKRYGDVYARVK